MNITHIKERMQRKPFRAFSIVLDSGDEIPVMSDTELIFPKSRPVTIYVFASDGTGWIFETQVVSALNDNGGGA